MLFRSDMWIHESFTTYSEAVFIECQLGKQKSLDYLFGLQKNVQNDKPIIGPYGVNKEGSGDMYPKGALMLNTIRSIVNDDDKWYRILYKYATTFRYKIIDSQTVINYFNKELELNLSPIFDQYLKYKNIPKLELTIKKRKLSYKWITDAANFEMPIDIKVKGSIVRIYPKKDFQELDIKIKNLNDIEILNDKYFIDVLRK